MKLKKLQQVKEEQALTEKSIKDFIFNTFEKYDVNGDGRLTREELASFFTQILSRKGLEKNHDPNDLAAKFISMIDVDGD